MSGKGRDRPDEDSDWLEDGNDWLVDGDGGGWEHEGLESFPRGSIPSDIANNTKCQRRKC
jgi:hypothetical protein